MSYTPDQLIAIATKYAKLASSDNQDADIDQPASFEKEYKMWKELHPDEAGEEEMPPTVPEHAALNPKTQFVAPLSEEEMAMLGMDQVQAMFETELESLGAKDKKKLDPKAKVRNRGNVCVPAEKAKDKKDHFPINDEGQARNALARVHQYSSKPEWWSGSLSGLQALVARKVKAKYPKIDVGGKKEKKSFEELDLLLTKYAELKPL